MSVARVTVRRATLADAATVAALNADAQALHAVAKPDRFTPHGPGTFPAAEVALLVATPERLLFLAYVGQEPAGYAHAEIMRRPESSMVYAHAMIHVHAMSVASRYQRRGVGRTLLHAVRDAGAELGISLVTLNVWSFNEPTRRFYRQLGFSTYIEQLCWRAGAGG
jgi:ribosomal protein S18 acetylase RimI-like enzyme